MGDDDRLSNRVKWLLILGVAVLFVAPLMGFGIFFGLTGEKHFEGPKTSYPIVTNVDDELKSYVNLTTTGMEGIQDSTTGNYTIYINGTVSWIDSPEDVVESMENIHLIMYTRLDSNETSGTLIIRHIGTHIEVHQDEFQLPIDAIDHVEVIIPKLGLDTAEYNFSLSCSTKLPE